jgi:hypothetical protein
LRTFSWTPGVLLDIVSWSFHGNLNDRHPAISMEA